MSDRDIILLEVARRGRDSAPAPTDYATMRADITDLKARPLITKLTDVPDVADGPADGDILVWDAAANGWVLAPPAPPIAVADTSSVDLTLAGTTLSAAVNFGTSSGTANEAARRDHVHTTPDDAFATFGPGSYLSSGSRPLASTSVVLAAGITYRLRAELRLQMRGADQGPCYYRLAVTIDGNTSQSAGGTAGFWAVQGVPDKTSWVHSRVLTGTGAAVSVSASVSYDSGGGFYTDAGELEVQLFPTR